MNVVVIGGGLMGTTTAWYLQRAGHDVTLVERHADLAAEGSHANGGILHAGHADPWNTPAVVGQLLRWIGREESPLLLRPTRLPYLARWGLGFLRHCRASHHRRVTGINTRLAVYSQSLMPELRREAGLDYAQASRGSLKLFGDPRALERAIAEAAHIEPLGVASCALDADGVVALEPALADAAEHIAGGVHFPGDESGDARAFVEGLGDALRAGGATLRAGESVTRIEAARGGIKAVVTDQATYEPDACVLASGVDAPRLARPLGVRLPIEPVKGYSATLPVPDGMQAPAVPLIDEAHQVVITRLGDRLRLAGTAEFAGHDRAIRERRVGIVTRQALSNFPRLAERVDHERIEPWACLRPVSVDGAPIIGATRVAGLYVNAGPGHLGWTFAAGAGRMTADLVSGREPALPPDEVTPSRFD